MKQSKSRYGIIFLIFIVIIILLVFSIFFIYSFLSVKELIKKPSENGGEDTSPEILTGDLDDKISGGGGGGSGGGESGDESGGESESSGDGLPDDFYTSPCGLYYQGYGVCGGVCSVGVCISEGRSCYCKSN